MRRLITLVALAVALPVTTLSVAGLFGCATPQEPLRASAPLKEGGRSDFLRCVAAEVTDRGYTITSSDAEIGVLKAERVTPETFTAVGQTDFIEAAAPGKTATVTAYTDATVTQLNGQNRANREVSDEAKADAAAIKAACLGEGPSLAQSSQQEEKYPVKISKDDFTKSETWSVTSDMMKDDERPSISRVLFAGVAHDRKDTTCVFRIYAILDTWMFISNIQIVIGDAEPVRFESIAKDHNAESGSVGEAVLFDCDAAELVVSAGTQRVRLRASGDKGYMTVTLDPDWVASAGRMLAKISPEQPPAPPAAVAPATSPEGAATPEASTETPPAAADER